MTSVSPRVSSVFLHTYTFAVTEASAAFSASLLDCALVRLSCASSVLSFIYPALPRLSFSFDDPIFSYDFRCFASADFFKAACADFDQHLISAQHYFDAGHYAFAADELYLADILLRSVYLRARARARGAGYEHNLHI